VRHFRKKFDDVTAVRGLPGKYRRIRSTNRVERLIEDVRRREKVIRIFPNNVSAWRYAGAVLVEIHEDWITSKRRYLDMIECEEWKAKNRFEPVKDGESEEDQQEEKVGSFETTFTTLNGLDLQGQLGSFSVVFLGGLLFRSIQPKQKRYRDASFPVAETKSTGS